MDSEPHRTAMLSHPSPSTARVAHGAAQPGHTTQQQRHTLQVNPPRRFQPKIQRMITYQYRVRDGLGSTQSINWPWVLHHFLGHLHCLPLLFFGFAFELQDYTTSNYDSAGLVAFHESLVQSVKTAGTSDEVATGLRRLDTVQNGVGILLKVNICKYDMSKYRIPG